MAEKVIFAMYDDDHTLLEGARRLVDKGVKVNDVFSPFPVHGLEHVIGVKRTRLAIVSFMFGITGLALALLGIWYWMIEDWPMNIGGKPSFSLHQNLPSFVPPTFEFTVFCAAHGMAITYLLRNKTLPGLAPRNPDPRTTDDKFVMKIVLSENKSVGEETIQQTLKESGSIEINEKNL